MLVVVLVLFAAFGLSLGVLYRYFAADQASQLKTQAALAAQGVSGSGISYFDGLEAKGYRITWMDADGRVLYDSEASAGEMENHLEREEIREALQDGEGESVRYSTTLTERQLYVARRLENGTIIRLSDSQRSIPGLLFQILRPLLLMILAAVILSLFLAYRLSRRIIRPLNELNLDQPAQSHMYEELTPLLRRIESQRDQLESEDEKAEKMRREFTANVSHELKTPLQTISGGAELLASGLVKTEDVPKFADRIYAESRRMIALVEDVIRLSHLDEGASDMEWEEIDLYKLAEDTVNNLRSIAREREVELELNGEETRIYGVRQLLASIVFNLCDNAVKYNQPGGKVRISVSSREGKRILTVADTGIGIPKENQERIFERFYRVDKSRSKEVGGTGLGLSIVKHAAKVMNAQIQLESTPGVGTTIRVLFDAS